jgi:hypothetical protein
MMTFNKRFALLLVCFLMFLAQSWLNLAMAQLPEFGRDTVLVWRILNDTLEPYDFVVRIARFLPDRYFEWENSSGQGTIFLTGKAIASSRVFLNARLFESGVDAKSREATTLWLSEQTYRDFKSKRRVKLAVDAMDEWLTFQGSGQITIEVNQHLQTLPVIKVLGARGTERWFLDSADNPLQVKFLVRKYEETLASITTDRHNTLRWIKGKKLTEPH